MLLATVVAQARSQTGLTLAFHIILACLGVALPAVVLIAHYLGLKRGDAAEMTLARRWPKTMAVLVSVGAISGRCCRSRWGCCGRV